MRIRLLILILIFIIAGVFIKPVPELVLVDYYIMSPTAKEVEIKIEPANKQDKKEIIFKSTKVKSDDLILLDVPFAAQAPFGEWNDPRQQDGCEEAASLMAVYWALGKDLTKQHAKEQILAAVKYQKDTYGEYRDTSATTTAQRLINEFFGYHNYLLKNVASADDIVKELEKGRVVITPMNGQALGNPYFTAPGPERHMLLIIGYDANTKEFITNDNGTRQGEKYQYSEETIFNSIRDYPSGYHLPITEVNKIMIVISKP